MSWRVYMYAQADELVDTNKFIDGEWGEPQTVSFNQRDLLLYAVGIGCTEMKFICEPARALKHPARPSLQETLLLCQCLLPRTR